MNQLPMEALTARDRERMAAQLYTLLGAQVKSYHKHYHMGDNSSIPVETARELTESIWYTVGMTGTLRGELADLLSRGQELLDGKMEDAQALYRLVCATVPEGQSQCHWETLRALGRYLDTYDHLHFAHRGPEWLDYPLLAPMPDGLRGIDSALFYLNSLWMENQILAGFPGWLPFFPGNRSVPSGTRCGNLRKGWRSPLPPPPIPPPQSGNCSPG